MRMQLKTSGGNSHMINVAAIYYIGMSYPVRLEGCTNILFDI